MKKLKDSLIVFCLFAGIGAISAKAVKIYTSPEPKIQHKKIDGCRWIKFPGETWQHAPNCDGGNHY